jgi:ornithine cyclodeaminase/alanine dehydrogenase-like protein (mu-crystallin family)
LPYDVIRAMQMLTEEDVRQKLDPARLIAALESAFRDRYPSAEIPRRTHINLDSGIFLLMPCYDRARDAMGMKLVTVQENPAQPQDRVQATYLLFDSQTASPKLTIPANYLTDLRTAATSAVATKFLAPENAATLGIFGTGRQARTHLQVLPVVRNFQRVLVCGRTHAGTESFVKEESGNIPIDPANAATVAAESDVICTCTTSPVPLFDGNLLRPGTHLNLVGSFQPHVREVDTVTVQRSRIFVDTYDGCLAEAGDLLVPIKQGAITRDHIVADLHELAASKKPGRTVVEQITLFKSVGCALEDLVAAELLL